MRIAFTGPERLIEDCAPDGDAVEVLRFADRRDLGEMSSAAPDAVVAIQPSPEERALLDSLDAPTLIWWPDEISAATAPARRNQRLVAGDSQDVRAWRSVPLPVADRVYAESAPPEPWRAAWLGPPTARRADHLAYFKGDAGLIADESAGTAAIAVNMHGAERPAFEHHVLRALAQGRLLVSETLEPTRGLEPGIDYVEVETLDDMFLVAEHATRSPGSFRRVRLRGRRKAELFRASRVIPRLIGDLMLELAAR